MKEFFRKFAERTADFCGSPTGFALFLSAIAIWMIVGFVDDFSDKWQAVFDITTNIVFLLLLLLMQNTQNRESKIIHLKLNELLRAAQNLVHDDPIVFEHIGDTYSKLNRVPQALDYWQKAMALSPENKLLAEKIEKTKTTMSKGPPSQINRID